MTDAQTLRSRLAEGMPPAWRDSFLKVPRHLFIPDTVWVRGTDDRPYPLRREDDPARWLEVCYSDAPVAVQLDDGDGTGSGYVSSTASMPTVVARMLDAADLSPGLRTLEIGTGTGYNAALLASVTGIENVTTIEIDAVLAERAATALERAGWPVEVVNGDGEKGCPKNAPFDRIMATAAVRTIPYTWVEQTRADGIVLTPFGTAFHSGALLRLRVSSDGSTAQGNFGGDAAFMWTRAQRAPHGAVEDRVLPDHDFDELTTGLHPHESVGDFDGSFAIGLRVPAMTSVVVFDDDDPACGSYTVYLMDPYAGSWASWRIEPGPMTYVVRQHGPRRLFDELETAYSWWKEVGSPAHTRFGLTVAPGGQHVWLDTPENEVARP
ncbi:methyltransferase domain-containing protein [Nocardiopsis sp. FIRDI 009]|uniref:methyltransferase domain-containing protein n=1 Tax=Nocardiopsis sp. FIRDI 009 TaxID=714197 RepID=UPI000E24E318|nr:methyltransferase domain-containing protein [Nocardiopsis sp. FIRDI 009]